MANKDFKLFLSISMLILLISIQGCMSIGRLNHATPIISKIKKHDCRRIIDRHYTIKNVSGLLCPCPTWLPVSVYNDGVSVFIEMPINYAAQNLKLYLLDGHHPSTLISYQKNKHYFRVDILFEKALLTTTEQTALGQVLITHH